MEIEIRRASLSDASELLRIYAPYIERTAVTYELDVPSVEEFAGRIENTQRKYPYLVATLGDKVVGYAYAGILKNREAYFCSAETSIYIDMDQHRNGVGRALYEALEKELLPLGVTNLYACIAYTERKDDPYLTDDSVRFHERMGYKLCGKFNRCAVKFDRIYDMIWMEKFIR